MRLGRRTAAFTLIELITVIIIIGIMLGVALPKYMKMAEKTKASNAKQVMDILRKAEEAYYAENTTYDDYDSTDTTTTSGGIIDEIPHAKIQTDDDWSYKVDAKTTSFNIEAKRKTARAHAGETITIDQDGNYERSSGAPAEWGGTVK